MPPPVSAWPSHPCPSASTVAVFTRTANPAAALPAADAVIGTAARLAVDALRARPATS
ncbi:hypothetical protein [Streptomyces thermocarboxydovorans]|uniref:hypothetical protein n=1 Tax=Streptomyces thermocarboxydovorans TaxID=59298 RepID=UPI0031DEAFA5